MQIFDIYGENMVPWGVDHYDRAYCVAMGNAVISTVERSDTGKKSRVRGRAVIKALQVLLRKWTQSHRPGGKGQSVQYSCAWNTGSLSANPCGHGVEMTAFPHRRESVTPRDTAPSACPLRQSRSKERDRRTLRRSLTPAGRTLARFTLWPAAAG